MMEEENRGVRRRRGMFEEFIGDGCCRGRKVDLLSSFFLV